MDLESGTAGPSAAPSSAWIAAATPQQGRSMVSTLVTIGAVVIGLGVVVAILGLNAGFFRPSGGHVLFGTAPGPNLCSVGGETRTAGSSDPVFFAAILRHRMAGTDAITLTITRDGQPFFDNEEPADGTEFECYGSRESIGPLEPGIYVFTVTRGSDVEATGTLTVT